MNILFLSEHCCIRCVKEGLALIDAGHSIVFLQKRIANPDMQSILPIMSFYSSPEQLKVKLGMFTDIDLIHVHNEPSSLVVTAKEERPDLSVIFDVHDLQMVIQREVEEDETKAMEVCDAVIFPSRGYRDLCLTDFAQHFPGLKEKPNEIIYSYCNESMFDLRGLARVRGIVYEGRVFTNGDYKDYRELIVKITESKIPFYLYPTNMAWHSEYAAAGAMIFAVTPFIPLLSNLARYDWGFCGPSRKNRQSDVGMPNKLFEYLAAGIPVMVYEAEEAAQFVTNHRVGVVIDNIEDIPKVYDQHEKYRAIVAEYRKEFNMESQVGKIVKLYGEVERKKKDERSTSNTPVPSSGATGQVERPTSNDMK